jgi:cell division GTPase FtsZ
MTISSFRAKRSKVGVAFFGGCGSNVLRLTIDGCNPKDYPDFYLFGANTDARILQLHFGKEDDPNLLRWSDFLILHQLGGDEVTRGRGAGGNPEVGRKAAETAGSVEAIKSFFAKVDEVFLVGGLGGGTGTGALPVAARLAREMGKPTLALVVMPDPEDGRTKKAKKALDEMFTLVPTIPIRNSYLRDMMSDMTPVEKAALDYKQAWRIVNENSVVPMLLILREILQVTGDVINLDEADWETMLGVGNYVLFGCDLTEKKLSDKSVEEISNELLSAKFQDPGLVTCGETIGFWWHGKWPKEKIDQVQAIVRKKVSEGRSKQALADEIEIHWGHVHEVKDEKLWVAVLIVAKNPSDKIASNSEISEARNRYEDRGIVRNFSDKSMRANSPIRFSSGGKRMEFFVHSDLAREFNRVTGSISSTKAENEAVNEKVKAATGMTPDLQPRFVMEEEQEKPKEGFFSGMFSTRPTSS